MPENIERAALGDRPHLDERPTYEPRAGQEWFIVTRLAAAIPGAIARWAPAAGRALDVGCGRQPFRRDLEARGLAYVGLDTQQNPEGTVTHTCPIDGPLPEGVGRFDFILCTEVMEHVADWPAAFENFRSLLNPGGRLLITCPHLYPLHEEPYDFWRATPYALAYFAARYGLRIVQQERVGDGLDALGTALAAIKLRAPKGSANPLAHLAAFAGQVWRSVALWFLRRGFARSLIRGETRLYVSNVIVLEAGGGGGGVGGGGGGGGGA